MLEADDDDMDAYSDVVAGDNTDGFTSGRGTRPSRCASGLILRLFAAVEWDVKKLHQPQALQFDTSTYKVILWGPQFGDCSRFPAC
jgi:hypothetical protein